MKTTLDEIQLYRVRDVRVIRTLGQKLVGVGSVQPISSDKSCPDMVLENIRHPVETKELIVELVNKARRANRVRSSELLDDLGTNEEDGGELGDDAREAGADIL